MVYLNVIKTKIWEVDFLRDTEWVTYGKYQQNLISYELRFYV